MNRHIRELALRFVQLKQAAVSESEEETSLDPRPSLPPPETKKRPARKPARRVFPFKRYKS